MDVKLRHLILVYLGCINLVKSNPLTTLYLDVDVRVIPSVAALGGSEEDGYAFEGPESMEVHSTGMFGIPIPNEPVDEEALFFTYNHDKLHLQMYKVDNCTYYRLTPRVEGSVRRIFRGMYKVWESKGVEEFMYMVFTKPVKGEMIIHMFAKQENSFRRYLYNTYTKIFYHVHSSKTIYKTVKSDAFPEYRADATVITHTNLIPRGPSHPWPERQKLFIEIPEPLKERARRREKELQEKVLMTSTSKPEESQAGIQDAKEQESQGGSQEAKEQDSQAGSQEATEKNPEEQPSSYYKPGNPVFTYNSFEEMLKKNPFPTVYITKDGTQHYDNKNLGSEEVEVIRFMHDPVLVELVAEEKMRAKYEQLMKKKEMLKRGTRKGIPRKLVTNNNTPEEGNDEDTSREGRLFTDDERVEQSQSQEEKNEKEEKKEGKGKGKGRSKSKSQGKGHGNKKSGDDDKPDEGQGQGGASAGGSGRSQASGHTRGHSSGHSSGTGSRHSERSGESSRDKDKHLREDEGSHGKHHQRGAMITQTSLEVLNRPRIIGPGGKENPEYHRTNYGNRRFAAMYQPESEYPNYLEDQHLLRNYPQSQNLEDCAEDVDCHLDASDNDHRRSSSRRKRSTKEDRRVPDQAKEATERATENTEPPAVEPQREAGQFEGRTQDTDYLAEPELSIINEIEKFIRPEWDQRESNNGYQRVRGAEIPASYSVAQQSAGCVKGYGVIPESHQFYHLQQSYQSRKIYHSEEPQQRYVAQQSYQTQQSDQSVPEDQEARGSHVLCIRGPKSTQPLVFPPNDPIFEQGESQRGSEFEPHLEPSNHSSPPKRLLLSQNEEQQLGGYHVGAVPTSSNENDGAPEPALGAVAAPMGVESYGMSVTNETQSIYQMQRYSPVSLGEGAAAKQDSENRVPAQEPGPSAPAQQAEGGAAAVPENKPQKEVKKKRHVRKTRVVRKTIYPDTFLQYYIAANTHGYMECEDMIPSLPILPILPEPQDVVESYTETESDTDTADEGEVLDESGRPITDPRSPRPTRIRSRRSRRPEPPKQEESACTIC